MKKNNDVILAAGGLVWKDAPAGKELAIIHRPKYDDWTLPKGKLKPGETWSQAAIREVHEETGCRVAIGDFVGCTCYQLAAVPKVVLYWNMKLIGKCDFQPGKEVDELQWLSVDDAVQRLDYETERELIVSNERNSNER